MRLLLDTHIALWLARADERLNSAERQLLLDHATQIFFSAVSIWELRLKSNSFHGSGDRKGPGDPEDALAVLRGAGYQEIPLTSDHSAAKLAVPLAHKDPFDELLLVQAQEEECKLLTRDAKLAPHPLAILA